MEGVQPRSVQWGGGGREGGSVCVCVSLALVYFHYLTVRTDGRCLVLSTSLPRRHWTATCRRCFTLLCYAYWPAWPGLWLYVYVCIGYVLPCVCVCCVRRLLLCLQLSCLTPGPSVYIDHCPDNYLFIRNICTNHSISILRSVKLFKLLLEISNVNK